MTDILIDTHTIYFELRRKYGKKLDLQKVVAFCRDFGTLTNRKIYGIQVRGQAQPFITAAEKQGFSTDWWSTQPSDKGKITNVSRITRDLLFSESDKIILCTSDKNYLPIIDYLIMQGKKVIILGCNISGRFKGSATLCIEIPESLTND